MNQMLVSKQQTPRTGKVIVRIDQIPPLFSQYRTPNSHNAVTDKLSPSTSLGMTASKEGRVSGTAAQHACITLQ